MAHELSISSPGARLHLGALSPMDGEHIVADAVALTVVSTGGTWSLGIQADGDLVGVDHDGKPLAPSRRIPLSRLRWGLSGTHDRHALGVAPRHVLADQGATSGSGRSISLDYALETRWGDAALHGEGTYRTTVVYTVTSGTVDGSYVSPDPFAPDGDDSAYWSTAFRFWLHESKNLTARVVNGEGTTVRTLFIDEPQTHGQRVLTWNGQDDADAPAPEGAYRFLVETPSAVLVASGAVRLEREAPTGDGQVVGVVHDQGGLPIPGASVSLRSASNLLFGVSQTGDDGAFAFEGVGAGLFRLEASSPGWFSQATPLFDVPGGETVVRDLQISPNRSMVLGLSASSRRVAVGDLVAFEAMVRAVGTATVTTSELVVDLPSGLKPVESSLTVDGVRQPERFDAINLGSLSPADVRRVRFVAEVVSGTPRHRLRAVARGRALGEPVSTEPIVLDLFGTGSELGGRGGLLGRVCFDVSGSGFCDPGDPPAPRALVFLAGGGHAEADENGRFHFARLRPGRHFLMAGAGPATRGRHGRPRLPRQGAAQLWTAVPAGQYADVAIALPPPPGYVPPPADGPLDEGDLPDLPGRRPARAPICTRPAQEDGFIDPSGRLVGIGERVPCPDAPAPARAAGTPGMAGLAEADGKGQHLDPAAPPIQPDTPSGPSLLVFGHAEATVGLVPTADGVRARPITLHAAGTLQREVGDGGLLTVDVDTRRRDREERAGPLDPLHGPVVHGDAGRTFQPPPSPVQLRLETEQWRLEAGRLSSYLPGNELIHLERTHWGVAAGVGREDATRFTVFAGVTEDVVVEDVLEGTDGVGPYRLSRSPVVPGSETVTVEQLGPGDEVRTRLPLRAGIDYVLDDAQGVIDLFEPLASRSPFGDRFVLRVRYESMALQPRPSAAVVGARAEMQTGPGRTGLTVVHEGGAADGGQAVALDTAWRLGGTEITGNVGMGHEEDPGSTRLSDRLAGRLRLRSRVTESTHLLAFGLTHGPDWRQRIRPEGERALAGSRFGRLDAHSVAPPLPQGIGMLLSSDVDGFPVALTDRTGRLEAGIGAEMESSALRVLAVQRMISGHDARHHRSELEVAATAEHLSGIAYAAHRVGVRHDSGWHDDAGSLRLDTDEVHTALGSLLYVDDWEADVVWQHRRLGAWSEPLAPDGENTGRGHHDVSAKLRYARTERIVPAGSVGRSWDPDGRRAWRVALGLEARTRGGWELQVYGSRRDRPGDQPPALGLSAGATWGGGRRGERLHVRYDLHSPPDEVVSHRIGWGIERRLGRDLVIASDGALRFGDDVGERLLHLSSAWRPHDGPIAILARVQQERRSSWLESAWVAEADDVPRLTHLAAADLGIRLAPHAALWIKGLWRHQRLMHHTATATLVAARIEAKGGSDVSLNMGARQLGTAGAVHGGASVEIAWRVHGPLWLAAGYNLAHEPEVFEIEGEHPGPFIRTIVRGLGVLGN